METTSLAFPFSDKDASVLVNTIYSWCNGINFCLTAHLDYLGRVCRDVAGMHEDYIQYQCLGLCLTKFVVLLKDQLNFRLWVGYQSFLLSVISLICHCNNLVVPCYFDIIELRNDVRFM